MRPFSQRLLRLLWQLSAGVLVVAALTSLALRYALRYLDQQPAIATHWVAQLSHFPIALGGLDAAWLRARPLLTLRDLRVIPQAAGGAALHFAQVKISLAPLESLRQGQLVLHDVELQGVSLEVRRERDGHFVVAGLPPTHSSVFAWLLRQPRIAVRDATVRFTDQRAETPPVTFTSPALVLRQVRGTTRIRGLAATSEAPGNPTDFQLQFLRGNPLNLAELRLALRAAPLAPLARFLGHPHPALADGSLTGRVWLRFTPQGLQRAALDLELALAHPTTPASELTLRGVAALQGDHWDLQFSDLLAAPDGRAAAVTGGVRGALRLGPETVHLALLGAALPVNLLAALPGAPGDDWRARAPQGELRGVLLGLAVAPAAPLRVYLAGKLHATGIAAQGGTPGFTGLEGALALNMKGGAVALDAPDLQLQHANYFTSALPVGAATGVVSWHSQAAGWQFETPGMQAVVQGLPLAIKGTAELQPGARPTLNIALSLGPGPLNALRTLVPQGVLPERGAAWLHGAFTGGRLEQLSVALRGNLADFPFDHGEGLFSAEFAFSDTTLKFSHDWLPLTGAATHGGVTGRRLQATLSAATFDDSQAGDISLQIEDVFDKEPVLRAQGTLHTNFPDVQRMLEQSPLQHLLAAPAAAMVLEGPFDLTLDLHIGLRHGARHRATGGLDFAHNRLRSPDNGLALERLTGRLGFAERRWFGEHLSATLDTMPVTLSAHGELDAQGHSQSRIALEGYANGPQIGAYVKKYAPSMVAWLGAHGEPLGALSGATAWRAVLATAPAANAHETPVRRLHIESSLTGLALRLPAPLGKTAAQAQAFELVTTFGEAGLHTTKMRFGTVLQATVKRQPLAAGGTDLTSLDLAFGEAEPVREQPGIYLHGRAAVLPLEAWASVLHASGGTMPTLPVRYDLVVADLDTLGQHFEAVTLRGEKDATGWLAHVESARVAGDIALPLDPLQAPLVLKLSRLWLTPRTSTHPQALIDPRSLPAVRLTCESFRYDDVDFGNTSLTTTRAAEGLNLEALTIANPAYKLTANGAWSLVGTAHHSQLNLTVKSPQLGQMLTSFGYATAGIAGAPAVVDLTAQWPGMPTQFTLEGLSGRLNLHVKEGRMLDIEPGTGRLFGLLSVQMLPRRLTLDFADFFKRGFAFDHIEGSFDIEHGNAYTDSLSMAGPSAQVEVSGRAGLSAQDYDQRAVVTPLLAASLPWAGAFFGPAGIGVAAAIYLGEKTFKQIPEQLNQLLSRRYAITGPWHDPKIERL